MEAESPLPHIQVSTTCPYSKPDHSSPFSRISLPEDPSLCYPPIYVWVFQVVLSFRFPHQDPVCTSHLPPIRATCPAHLILLDLIARISGEYRPLSSSLCSFLHSPVTSSLLGPNILFSNLFSNTLSLRTSINVCDHVSHPYKGTASLYSHFIQVFDECRIYDQ